MKKKQRYTKVLIYNTSIIVFEGEGIYYFKLFIKYFLYADFHEILLI